MESSAQDLRIRLGPTATVVNPVDFSPWAVQIHHRSIGRCWHWLVSSRDSLFEDIDNSHLHLARRAVPLHCQA
jgi:hypothetical protein